MIKTTLSIVCALALIGYVAQAQTSTSTSTTNTAANGESATTTSTTESSGTITDYSPGASLVLSTGTGEPVHYKFSKKVTYVTADGKVIEATKVHKNSKVRVHYVKDADGMVVDKVIVEDKD